MMAQVRMVEMQIITHLMKRMNIYFYQALDLLMNKITLIKSMEDFIWVWHLQPSVMRDIDRYQI